MNDRVGRTLPKPGLIGLFRWLVLLVLGWGVVAFGALYPWAYWPLLIGCLATGGLGLVIGSRPLNRSIVLGLVVVVAAVLSQLAPVPRSMIASISPATDTFLRQYDLVEIAAALPPVASALNSGASPPPTRPRVRPLTLDAAATRRGLLFIIGFGVFVLGLTRALSRRDIRFLIAGLTILAVVLTLAVLVQKTASNGAIYRIYGIWLPRQGGTPFGPFVNPNNFAGWVLMLLPLVAGDLLGRLHGASRQPRMTMRERILWLSSPQASQILLMGVSLLIMALALVLTLSRSAIGSFAIVLVFIGWIVVRTDRLKSRRAGTLACLAVLAVVSVGWVGLDRVAKEFVGGDTLIPGLAGRQLIWRDTLEIVRDFPLVGSGLNTYKTAMLLYEDPRDFGAVRAHNDYLQLAAEGGLLVGIAAVFCLGLFISEVRRLFRTQGDTSDGYWIRIGAVAGLIGMACQETVEFSLQMPGNAVLFSFLCAVSLSNLRRDSPHRVAETSKPNPNGGWLFVAAVMILSVASGMIAYRSGGLYGERLNNPRVHRIYDVPAKRLVAVLYDASGNGLFDTWIDLANPSAIVIQRDSNEDGLPEYWEHYGPEHQLDKIGVSTRADGKENVWRSYNPDGTVKMIEYSATGDGVITHREFFTDGPMIGVEGPM